MTLRYEIGRARLHKSDDLCALVEELGYKQKGRFAINQLQCSNGAFASSLLSFFDDNPDAMEAVKNWILENSSQLEAFDGDEEGDDEEEDEEVEETDES